MISLDWLVSFWILYCNHDTVFSVSVFEKAVLHGIIAKIRDLNRTYLLVGNLPIKDERIMFCKKKKIFLYFKILFAANGVFYE